MRSRLLTIRECSSGEGESCDNLGADQRFIGGNFMSSQFMCIESSLGWTMELESILADSQSTVLTITLCSHQRRLLNNRMLILHFNRCIIRVAERILIWWFRKNSNLRPLPRQGSILPLKYGTDLICSCENAHPEKEFINASAFDITKRELSPLFSRPNKTFGVSGGFRDLMKWICNPLPNRSATLTSFFWCAHRDSNPKRSRLSI